MLKDICSFIDSDDVRNHLETIGYEPTPAEAAGIIYSSDLRCLADKQAAMRELLESTEDTPIEGYIYTLHQLIEDQLSAEDICAEEFFRDDDSEDILYMCRKDSWDFAHEKTLKACFDKIKHYHMSSDICKIFKIDLKDAKHHYPYVEVKNGEIMSIEDNRTIKFRDIFKSLYKDLPLPFKSGDILYFKNPAGHPDPFVYIGKRTEPPTEDNCFIEGNMEIYDIDTEGSVYKTYCEDFIKACRYKGSLSNTKALLRPLSAFINNEIDIILYTNACHIILDRARAKQASKTVNLSKYTDEQLESAGLSDMVSFFNC